MAFTTTRGHVSGFAGLEQALTALSKEVATKIGASATRKGAKIMVDAVKAAAPESNIPEGQVIGVKRPRPHLKIKNNIKVRKGRSSNQQNATMLISIEAFHSLFIERGTIHMQARPFAGPAVASVTDKALDTIADQLKRGIARANRSPRP